MISEMNKSTTIDGRRIADGVSQMINTALWVLLIIVVLIVIAKDGEI